MGSSSYCYLVFNLREESDYSVQVNFNIFNDPSSRFDAPVYFREGLVSAKTLGSKTIYHVISYVRGPKMNAFQKLFGRNFIETTQQQVFENLNTEIKKSGVRN